MSQNISYFQLNKRICEASGCFAEATTKIEVKAGKRLILLNLCRGCVHKFVDG
jgi:hypothetical protein